MYRTALFIYFTFRRPLLLIFQLEPSAYKPDKRGIYISMYGYNLNALESVTL